MEIRLGPAGLGNVSLEFLKDKGLNFCEVTFTYRVYMDNEEAREFGELAKSLGIGLSCHAEYWINLVSKEKKKIEQSKRRILNACEKAHYMRAECVVFHVGFYQGRDVFDLVKDGILDLQRRIKGNNWKVKLAPETTGKISQFGTLEELIKLVKETRCGLCIDPAHLYARSLGKINYKEMFDKLDVLKFKKYHFHFSGIEFTKRGEKRHLNMGKPDFNEFAKEILKRKISVNIVSESPVTWVDSIKQKKIFEKLGYRFF